MYRWDSIFIMSVWRWPNCWWCKAINMNNVNYKVTHIFFQYSWPLWFLITFHWPDDVIQNGRQDLEKLTTPRLLRIIYNWSPFTIKLMWSRVMTSCRRALFCGRKRSIIDDLLPTYTYGNHEVSNDYTRKCDDMGTLCTLLAFIYGESISHMWVPS